MTDRYNVTDFPFCQCAFLPAFLSAVLGLIGSICLLLGMYVRTAADARSDVLGVIQGKGDENVTCGYTSDGLGSAEGLEFSSNRSSMRATRWVMVMYSMSILPFSGGQRCRLSNQSPSPISSPYSRPTLLADVHDYPQLVQGHEIQYIDTCTYCTYIHRQAGASHSMVPLFYQSSSLPQRADRQLHIHGRSCINLPTLSAELP